MLKYTMLSVYLVKVKVYNSISVHGVCQSIQCHQCTWCKLTYAMLSVYLVQLRLCKAIRVPGDG